MNVFWDHVDSARARIGISGSFPKRYSNELLFQQAQKESYAIIEFFDLPSSWLHPLSDFIVMDKFTSLNQGIFLSGKAHKVAEDKESGKLKVDNRSPDLHIIIKRQMSIKALQEWIEDNRNAI